MELHLFQFGASCAEFFFNTLLPLIAVGIFGWLLTPEDKTTPKIPTRKIWEPAPEPMATPTPRTLMEVMVKTRPSATHKPFPATAMAAAASGHSRLQHMIHNVDCDEVYPNIFVGNESSARNIQYLKSMGVTHVLNAAEGTQIAQICTGEDYYKPAHIQYLGLLLHDVPTANIAKYFDDSCRFIDTALRGGGKVLVHCFMGVSRSATLVIAYLMIHKNMSVEEALKTVRQRRAVGPNQGFLQQLCDLQIKLNAKETS